MTIDLGPNKLCIFSMFQEFIGDEKGNVTGIRTVKVEWVKVQIVIF